MPGHHLVACSLVAEALTEAVDEHARVDQGPGDEPRPQGIVAQGVAGQAVAIEELHVHHLGPDREAHLEGVAGVRDRATELVLARDVALHEAGVGLEPTVAEQHRPADVPFPVSSGVGDHADDATVLHHQLHSAPSALEGAAPGEVASRHRLQQAIGALVVPVLAEARRPRWLGHVLGLLGLTHGREHAALAAQEVERTGRVVGPGSRQLGPCELAGGAPDLRVQLVRGSGRRVQEGGVEPSPGQAAVAPARCRRVLLEQDRVEPQLLGAAGRGPPRHPGADDDEIVDHRPLPALILSTAERA